MGKCWFRDKIETKTVRKRVSLPGCLIAPPPGKKVSQQVSSHWIHFWRHLFVPLPSLHLYYVASYLAFSPLSSGPALILSPLNCVLLSLTASSTLLPPLAMKDSLLALHFFCHLPAPWSHFLFLSSHFPDACVCLCPSALIGDFRHPSVCPQTTSCNPRRLCCC